MINLFTQQKKFCTYGVLVNFCLNQEWMHLMLYIIVYRNCFATIAEIQGSLRKQCVFKVSRGHPSKVAKLPIIASGADNMEYLVNPSVIHLPARPAGLARKNRRWRKILKLVHPFGASFCRSARLCSVFYHTKVRLVNIYYNTDYSSRE